MRRRLLRGAAAVALCTALAACGASNPPDDISGTDLFAWAQDRFDNEDWGSARNGFQNFMLRDPLSALTDSAQYMLAESMLRFGQELEAADEFSRLAIGRPNSTLADDAQFGVCRAYLEASPRATLSQEYTVRAISECERLLQFFPGTELRTQAEELLATGRNKLAEQSYAIGKYYYDRRFYESANVYLEKAVSERPGPELMPRVLATMYQSYRRIGFDTEARVVRDRLLAEFPDSEEAARVRDDDPDGS